MLTAVKYLFLTPFKWLIIAVFSIHYLGHFINILANFFPGYLSKSLLTQIFSGNLPSPLFSLVYCYFYSSIITLIVYAEDKSAARERRWRTPESILHFLEILGGWPGALIAQQVIRHKNKKKSFQLVYNLIIFFHFSLWVNFFLVKGQLYWLSILILFVIYAARQRYKGQKS